VPSSTVQIHAPRAPDVSVVIAAWRDADTILEAIGSALDQKGVEIEVIVVDDASPDRTGELAQALARDEPLVRVFRRGVNRGPGAARNLAFSRARGRWIAVLDADDAMEPDRLRRLVDLGRRTDADIVLGNLREVGGPRDRMPFLPADRPAAPLGLRDFVRGNVRAVGGRNLGYLKPLISNDFVRRHGLRYDESLRNGEDCHLVLSAFALGARVWFHPAPDYSYRRRSASLSARSRPADIEALLAAESQLAPRLAAMSGGSCAPGAGRSAPS
jgi:succinoglycan biosynthesis protein ExoO